MFAIRLGSFEFAPTLLPTVAAACAVVLTVLLGNWQLNRAGEKEVLQYQYAAIQTAATFQVTGKEEGEVGRRLQFRQLLAEGEFEADKQIFLDNQVENGQAGYHVLAPLKLKNSKAHVLVNRGWIARSAEYPAPPYVATPVGQLKLQGYGLLPSKRFLELSTDTIEGKVWENITIERYERATGLKLLPIILVQTVGNAHELKAIPEHHDFGIAKHQGYAFQWFALSATVIAIYLYLNTRSMRK
jgi:surfeit locus 1 family protein